MNYLCLLSPIFGIFVPNPLNRSPLRFSGSGNKSTRNRLQRFAAARQYLRTHRFMRIKDYMELTGLSYTTAQRELKLAATLTHSGIAATGSGSHRLYVLSAAAAAEGS